MTAAPEPFPPVPLESWQATLATLHRFAQVVGKHRLAASPRRNHWWNVPFHLTGSGLTTRPMRADGTIFCIDLDLLDHRLDVTTVAGRRQSFALAGQSVASFTAELDRCLASAGVAVTVARPRPFDLPDADRPFAQDDEHATYDQDAVTRYWRVLSELNLLLEEFAGRWAGKTSPVHHFWHTFDIAVTRFGERHVDHPAEVDPVTREAYSREVISSGFWFGDTSFPEPALYSYTAPEPAGLTQEPLRPAAARWVDRGPSSLAVLRYDDLRASSDPRATALEFYESAFQAGATRAGWDLERERCVDGATDPHLHGGLTGAAR